MQTGDQESGAEIVEQQSKFQNEEIPLNLFRSLLISSALFAAFAMTFGVAARAAADNDTRGADVFARSCAMCHAITAGAPTRLGPNLAGIAGRKAASEKGFAYSRAMASSGLTWNATTLDSFLAKPSAVVPGNRMGFGGVTSAEDRAALIKYLMKAK